MTRKTPTKKKMVKENQNTPCKERKRTPIKESKMTPTRGRFKVSTSQGKKMFTTILRGIKLGWGYFLRARPDTYEDLDMWMIKTWGSSQPETRRGFHLNQLKKDYISELKSRYEQVYDTTHIVNNEVGTVFARAFACELHGGIEVDWEDFAHHRSSHYRGSSSTNTTMKSEGTSHIEIPARTSVVTKKIAKQRATLTEKHEERLLCCIASLQTRMQALLTDLEEVSSSEMAAEKQFTSISNTYEWITTTIQHSESDVLKEELKKELANMGTQLGKQKKDLETWRSSRAEIDDKLSALKSHSENLTCLMKGLKDKGLDPLWPEVVEHPTCNESTTTRITVSR